MDTSKKKKLVAVGVVAAAAIVGGAFLLGGSAEAASLPPDPTLPPDDVPSSKQSQAERDAADAFAASSVFALAVAAANSIVAAAASPAAVVYTGPASAAVAAVWSRTSVTDKAHIWRGELTGRAPRTSVQPTSGGIAPPAKGGGALGAAPKIPKGAENLVKWIVAEMKKQIKGIGQFACDRIDQTLNKLRNAGAKLPKSIDSWSCDQKIAFVVALGPLGVTVVLTGALTGALATNTAKEVERNLERAKSAVKDLSAKLGIKVPSFDIGGTAGQILDKLYGLRGFDQIQSTGKAGEYRNSSRLAISERKK